MGAVPWQSAIVRLAIRGWCSGGASQERGVLGPGLGPAGEFLADVGEEAFGVIGLGEEVVDADVPEGILVLAADRGAANHHPLGGVVALDPAADFHPGHDRHLEVNQEEIKRAFFEELADPFATILSLLD